MTPYPSKSAAHVQTVNNNGEQHIAIFIYFYYYNQGWKNHNLKKYKKSDFLSQIRIFRFFQKFVFCAKVLPHF